MTTKKTETQRKEAGHVQQDLHTAYRIHTLAHTIYGQLAATHPWLASFATPDVFMEPSQWPPSSQYDFAGPLGERQPWMN